MPGASILIFANPIAGRGRGKTIAQRVAEQLAAAGLSPHIIFGQPSQTDDAHIPDNLRAAIAIGGDGTIRSVAARMLRLGSIAPPLLIIPMGTANLLGRHLHLNWTEPDLPRQVTDAIQTNHTIELDAARANDQLFLLMTGVGMDARIVHELDRLRAGPIDYTSYVLPAALALGTYTYPPLTVSVDNKTICQDLPAIAFVGNIKEYGTGFPILPHARPDDGILDVCILPVANRRDVVKYLMYAAAGEHLNVEGTLYTRGKHIHITSPQQVPVQLDGDAAGHTPVTIDLLPQRLRFIVPSSAS